MKRYLMSKDILAAIISLSLIFIYNGLLNTNIPMKWILGILGSLFAISVLLASPSIIFALKWFLSLKTLLVAAIVVGITLVLYNNQNKKT